MAFARYLNFVCYSVEIVYDSSKSKDPIEVTRLIEEGSLPKQPLLYLN